MNRPGVEKSLGKLLMSSRERLTLLNETGNLRPRLPEAKQFDRRTAKYDKTFRSSPPRGVDDKLRVVRCYIHADTGFLLDVTPASKSLQDVRGGFLRIKFDLFATGAGRRNIGNRIQSLQSRIAMGHCQRSWSRAEWFAG